MIDWNYDLLLLSPLILIDNNRLKDITFILTNSTDYDELTYVWSEWRKVASKPMREDYKKYVELENIAAKANGTPIQLLIN